MRRIFSTLCAFLMLGGIAVAQSSVSFDGAERADLLAQSAKFADSKALISAGERTIAIPQLNQAAADSYFAFCDRSGKENKSIGTGKAGLIGGAILLPAMPGNEIKGVKFAVDCKVPRKAVAYVLAYNTDDSQAGLLVAAAKQITANQGVNQVSFDKPYVIPEKHLILVGYQIEAVDGKEGGFPIVLDGQPMRFMSSDFIVFGESLLKVGDNVKDFQRYDGGLGNVYVMADINDKTNKLAHLVGMTKTLISSDKPNKDGEIAADKQIELTLLVSNLGRSTVTKIEGMLLGGFSAEAPRTPFTQAVNIPAQTVATITIPTTFKTIKRGLGAVGIIIDKYNDVKTEAMVIPDQQAEVLSYKVPTKKVAIPRNSVLFERFTTEKCVNCPPADGEQERLIEGFQRNPAYKNIKTNLLIHHSGFYTDFLTLTESNEMLKYAFAGGGTFAPAFMCNRMPTPQGLVHSFRQRAPHEEIEATLKKIAETEQQVVLTKVDAKLDGDKLSLSVEGEAGYVMDDQLHFTAVLTEDNIAPRNQSGVANFTGKGPFMHQAVARQFFTAFNGDPVKMEGDGKFSFKLDQVALKNKGWKREDLKLVIFAHQNLKFPSFAQREVFASMTLNYKELTATLDILPEDMPAVSVYNGYLTVTGAAEGVEVFDMAGRLVSTTTAKQLSRGVYVVKVTTAHGPFTHKVVVE